MRGRAWMLAGLLAMTALPGCTRSMEMNYSPALYRLPQADQLANIVLGVAKLEDRRTTIDRSDLESLGYVMRAGAWKQHKLEAKGPKRRRRLRKKKLIDRADAARLKVLVPYL